MQGLEIFLLHGISSMRFLYFHGFNLDAPLIMRFVLFLLFDLIFSVFADTGSSGEALLASSAA